MHVHALDHESDEPDVCPALLLLIVDHGFLSLSVHHDGLDHFADRPHQLGVLHVVQHGDDLAAVAFHFPLLP